MFFFYSIYHTESSLRITPGPTGCDEAIPERTRPEMAPVRHTLQCLNPSAAAHRSLLQPGTSLVSEAHRKHMRGY